MKWFRKKRDTSHRHIEIARIGIRSNCHNAFLNDPEKELLINYNTVESVERRGEIVTYHFVSGKTIVIGE